MNPPDHLPRAAQLHVVHAPEARDLRFLDERVDEFNIARTGITDVHILAIVVRDGDGAIVAGAHGWTWGRCCEIRTLWVHEAWRGEGLGTRLMTAAEAEARAHGAAQIVLSTHSFQAPEFYRRLGFEIVGVVDDYPVGYRSFYLRKPLR